jgi:signal transduction histidine kinase
MILKSGGRSILNQTFWLLVGSVFIVQGISIASVFLLPLPRPEGVALMQIADRLQNDKRPRPMRSLPDLPVHHRATPPAQDPNLVSDPRLDQELAERLGIDARDVRIYFRPDQSSSSRRAVPGRDGIVRWRGEPFFYNRAVVAARMGPDWRVIQTPDRPMIAEWQKRMAFIFALAVVALLPLAWLFARHLVKPIRAFADSADRVGRDASAPMVREDGPTELRVAARAVNAMQGRIADQMKEREAMVAAIAHDLRTPLSRIAFRIESADDALREPIQRDIDQMKSMISATLNFVRGSSRDAHAEPVDLADLVEEIVGDEAHVGRPVEWPGRPRGDCTVRGDRVALGRMIQNLVDNAIVYGGQAELALERSDRSARIEIADRGPGLAPDEIDDMFAPFARKDRSRNRETGGTGLGLAIARSIARDHGGDVTLAPRAGGGLQAVVTLPLAGEM